MSYCWTLFIYMNKKDIHLSKCLSWVLRHGAVKEGLPISSDGYVAVHEILQHRSFKNKYHTEDIKRVVETNSKQRFKLRLHNITLEIKAVQGHSIEDINDTELIPILLPKYKTVVHGTYFRYWNNIKENGLSCMQRNHIHLAKGTLEDRNIKSGLRSDTEVYIYINLELALNDGIKFYESENGVILTPGNGNRVLETKYFTRVIAVRTGFPGYTQARELEHAFAACGRARVERVTNGGAVLRFESPAHAAAALRASCTIMLYGAVLTVGPVANADLADPRPRRQRDRTEKTSKRGRSQKDQNENLKLLDPSKIDFSGNFHEQLASVLTTVRLSQEEVTNISRLYADVETALQENWPGCKAVPFGSLTSGLGIKTSDADCFVHVPEESRRGETLFVNKAKKLLQRRPDTFARVLSIPRANTPIVKLLHLPTSTHCDLSFKTPLGVRNSGLIAFLLHVDPRLKPVAVLIKYWGKVGGFTGSGKLTNYALTMLLIFYLQQLGILPAVSRLQAAAPAHHVGSWNTGFLYTYQSDSSASVQATIPELIGGFFEYYVNFNFREDVVCPFLGRTVKKSAFEDLSLLPSEFQLYVHNVREKITSPLRVGSAMCVQDPFEQCHNVASVISERCAEEVKAFFDFAAKAYEQEKSNDCIGFLKMILLQKPKLPPRKTSPEFRANLTERVLQSVRDPDWQSVVRKITFQIFEQIFKLKIERLEEEKPSVKKNGTKEKYVSTLDRNVWKRKKFIRFYDLMNLNFLEKQIRITEEILNVDKTELNIKFQLAIYFSSIKRNATIILKVLEGDGSIFRDFSQYFLSVANLWVKQLLNRYIVPETESNNKADKGDDNVNISIKDNDDAVSSEEENSTDTDSHEEENNILLVEDHIQAMENNRQAVDIDRPAVKNDIQGEPQMEHVEVQAD